LEVGGGVRLNTTIGGKGVFQLCGDMITNNASCTLKSKSRTAMAKTAFYKKKTVFAL
jgi:hypothetical protein